MGPDSPEAFVAAILNAAWLVRHYARGGRSALQRKQRDEAIKHLAITCRDALNGSDSYELILGAIVDGLRPRDDPPF